MKIMVPLDGSTAAGAALPEAANRAKRHAGARLVLVRAVDPASVPRSAGSGEQARAISEAAEYLGKVAARLRSEGIDRVGRAVWSVPTRRVHVESQHLEGRNQKRRTRGVARQKV